MNIAAWGAMAFGSVIGWFIYYVNRYRKGDVQISDVTTLIGAIGGAAVLALFRSPGGAGDGELFGAYGIGLAVGFFAYYFSLLVLVGISENFDSDWFLDGRRAQPKAGVGYSEHGGVPMMPPPPAVAPTQIFNLGIPQGGTTAPKGVPMVTGVASAGSMEDDPAAPSANEISETADFDTARTLANLGSGPVEESVPEASVPAILSSIGVDINRAQQFLQACMSSHPRVTYGLGAKVPFHGATPGTQFARIDCSGFVREAIRLSTNPMVPFPDGSVVQHDWVRNKGHQKVGVGSGTINDNRVRIAFLRPQDSPSNIGHVVLIHNGRTLESHGGVGPDSRPWSGAGWQAKAYVYEIG